MMNEIDYIEVLKSMESDDANDIVSIQEYIEGIGEPSLENFAQNLLLHMREKFHAFTISRGSRKRLISDVQKIHLATLRASIKKTGYIPIVDTVIPVEDGFSGKRTEYLNRLINLNADAQATTWASIMRAIYELEQAITNGTLTVLDLDTEVEKCKNIHRRYQDLLKDFFKGNGDVSTLGTVFLNSSDIIDYMKVSKKVDVKVKDLEALKKRTDELSERIKMLNVDFEVRKGEIKRLADALTHVSQCLSDTGKISYLLDTNGSLALKIYEDINKLV